MLEKPDYKGRLVVCAMPAFNDINQWAECVAEGRIRNDSGRDAEQMIAFFYYQFVEVLQNPRVQVFGIVSARGVLLASPAQVTIKNMGGVSFAKGA